MNNHTPKNILISGGAGFIGCNLVHYYLNHCPDINHVINLDALTYAGSLNNLSGLDKEYPDRYTFIQGNICDSKLLDDIFIKYDIDTVAHLAAESHVDRSIDGPKEFLETNIIGTFTMLQSARKAWGNRTDVRFHHVSTDEVYGSLGNTGKFTEETRYDPSSPYSSSKASSDHIVRAWHRTYGLPVTISNCSNNYGAYQFPEKLIPLMIQKALAEEKLPIYGKGDNVRDWLYVVDHCTAIDKIIRKGKTGRTYNVGGCNEWSNLELVHLLCDILQSLKKPESIENYRELINFVTDRPGHDMRYAIDATRIQDELGWEPSLQFEEGLRKTIEWYLQNTQWREAIRKEKYSGERLGK